jgi:cysteine synthase A
LVKVRLQAAGSWRYLWLKLEAQNRSGSIKYRTAVGLVHHLLRTKSIDGGDVLLESTSGNLGIALALVARELGIRFCAVVDPKVQEPMLQKMRSLGASIHMVSGIDAHGSFLEARLEYVRELVSSSSTYLWTNQYESAANPDSHETTTGPELWRQSSRTVDAVFIAVSTGGTLAGVARYLRAVAPNARVIAVDAVGSSALGTTAAPRYLTGIGSSRKSSFIESWMYDAVICIADGEAFAMCNRLKSSLGILVGGSSGAVVAACLQYLESHPEIRMPVCLCADGGENYKYTIFDEGWLEEHGFRSQGQQRNFEWH